MQNKTEQNSVFGPGASPRGYAVLLLLALCLLLCGAAKAGTDEDMQIWTPITLDIPLRKKLRAYFEVNPRMGDGVSSLKQLLIRPGIEYRHNESFSLFAGYLWLTSYNNNEVLHEHRIWQQLFLDRDIKRFYLLNRTRLEQRFFSNLAGTGHRIRNLMKVNYRLNKYLYLTNSNELFVNLNSVADGPERGIDQDRYFVGIGISSLLGGRGRLEFGYQYQYVNRSDQFDDQANHALVFQSFFGLKD